MAPFVRRSCGAVAVTLLGGVLVGCFTTTADFRTDAETFLVEDADLRRALFADTDATITTATCAEPANQDEGTTFPCTAVDTNGDTWEFEIVINGRTEYDVNVSRRPPGT